MNKLNFILIVSTFAATAYGNTTINNSFTGKEQKITSVPADTIKVPYTLYNEGKGSYTDNIDSSKIDFSKQFLILVNGEIPATGARLIVKSIILRNNILTLTYKLEIAGKPVSPSSPNLFFFALIVDKKYRGEIKLVDKSDR